MTLREKLYDMFRVRKLVKVSAVAEKLDADQSLIYRWYSKNPDDAGRQPTAYQALVIAREAGVSVESLIDPEMELTPSAGKSDAATHLSPDEIYVLGTFRDMRDLEGLTANKAGTLLSRHFEGTKPPHPDEGTGSR